MDLRSRKAETRRRSLSEKDLRQRAPFWVLYKSAALLQNRPGIGFLWQKFTIPLFRDSANFWKCYER